MQWPQWQLYQRSSTLRSQTALAGHVKSINGNRHRETQGVEAMTANLCFVGTQKNAVTFQKRPCQTFTRTQFANESRCSEADVRHSFEDTLSNTADMSANSLESGTPHAIRSIVDLIGSKDWSVRLRVSRLRWLCKSPRCFDVVLRIRAKIAAT